MTLIGTPEPPMEAPEPPDIPDYLCDHPHGFCPWDGSKLMVAKVYQGETPPLFCSRVSTNASGKVELCDNYRQWETETENRIRYAAERLEDAEEEEFRYQTRRRGGEL